MESLRLIDFSIDETKDTYYFNKYPYKLRIYCNGIEYARRCHSENELDVRLARLSVYIRNNSMEELVTFREKILELLKIRESYRYNSNLKFVVQHGIFNVYSTNICDISDIYSRISSFNYKIEKSVSIKRPDYSSDVVYIKDPKHQYRCYLTTKMWTEDEKTQFYKYARDNKIRLCPSLKSMLLWKHPYSTRIYTWSSMFIDVDDETQMTYLSLKFSNIIRKICKIEKR
jgi:hypothetical protein